MTSRYQDSSPRANIDVDAIEPAPRNVHADPYRDSSPVAELDGQAEQHIRIRSPAASPDRNDTEANMAVAAAQGRREPVSRWWRHDPKHNPYFPHFDIDWHDCSFSWRTLLGCLIVAGGFAGIGYGIYYAEVVKPREEQKKHAGGPNNKTLYF